MCIEKIRKKRKRITEVVELKPVDIEAHRRALAVKKSKEAARERERLMGPQRTPKPVFQPFDDDEVHSSKGATRYKADELDMSSNRHMLKIDYSLSTTSKTNDMSRSTALHGR